MDDAASADPVADAGEAAAGARRRRRGRWLSAVAKFLVGVLLGLLAAFLVLLAFLDTDAGHRFLADRIAA